MLKFEADELKEQQILGQEETATVESDSYGRPPEPAWLSRLELSWGSLREADAIAMPPRTGLRLQLYAALVVLDILLVGLAFLAGDLFRHGLSSSLHDAAAAIVILPIYVVLAAHACAYSIDVLKEPRLSVQRALRSFLFTLALCIGIAFYLKLSADFSRIAFGLTSLIAILLLGLGRWTFGKWQGRRVGWRFTNDIVLVDEVPYRPRRGEITISSEAIGLEPALDDPDLLDRAGRLFQNCDRIILACPPHRRTAWAQMLRSTEKNVEVLAPELDAIGAIGLHHLGDRGTILVSRGPLGLCQALAKRSFDLAISLPLLLVLSPLMALIALAIKLDSRGPVFFRQPRVGQDNRIFHVLKFRSMHVETSDQAGAQSTAREDGRITRVGRWIRKCSLDELPQLLNVVKGEMSIVGPRPHALGSTAGDELFWNIDRRYWQRHKIKPGITGLAQVRGYRGPTECKSDLQQRLKADLEYVNCWSLVLDFLIVLRTIRVLVHARAY